MSGLWVCVGELMIGLKWTELKRLVAQPVPGLDLPNQTLINTD